MSDDLISLGVVVVSGLDSEREAVRQGAGFASMPVDLFVAERAREVVPRLARGSIDLILIGSGVPHVDKKAIVASARARMPAPFVVALAKEPPALDDGLAFDGAQPVKDAAAATALIDVCVKAQLPKRVLVVDDSATTRRVVCKILSASRFPLQLAEAQEGGEALQQVESGKVDLVVLDYRMPGLSGAETLTKLKREHPRVAVVMMTATDDPAVADCARAAGAAFVRKPFYPADIDAVLNGFYGFGSLKPAA